MEGRLIVLPRDGLRKTSVFVTGNAHRCILVVGSQTETLFATPFVEHMVEKLGKKWAVAQVMLGSSIVGQCEHGHDVDADDVAAALGALVKEQGMDEVVLYASGTGVQVALEVLASKSQSKLVTRVIFHGGILPPQGSALFSVEATQRRVEFAHKLIEEKRGNDTSAMLKVYDMVVTPGRLFRDATLTVQEAVWQPALGESFSTCKKTLRGVTVPVLFLLSTEASYTAAAKDALPTVQEAVKHATGLPAEDIQISLIPSTIDEYRRGLNGNAPLVIKTINEFIENADERRDKRASVAAAEAAREDQAKRIALSKALSISQ
ncbi:hypothetical protein JKF63_00754 [Porcisia hertigi]|uniref:Uncharacterized protein n=1 Tax=Porcisia hertigi TaxID=2761500 RepID=A0A836IA55_9TRYP|nr:hypothetical protein JKF63_00754 [Porcisia hertigi]